MPKKTPLLTKAQNYPELHIDDTDFSFKVIIWDHANPGEKLFEDGGQGDDYADARAKAIAMRNAEMPKHLGE